MFNKVILVGRLGKDPEIRYSAGGAPVGKMRIATDESYTDRESGARVKRTEWHTVVVFQRQAEMCKNYLSKGSLICVEGSLQTSKWQDQQGQDRYSTEVKANRVTFLDRKSDAGMDGAEDEGGYPRHGGSRAPAGRGQTPSEPLGPSEFGSEIDDVPF